MKRTIRTGTAAILAMTVLILDTKTAMLSAQKGISLCIYTVIPSLLPFFVLSSLLTGSLAGHRLKILRPVERICRIGHGSGILVLIGLLGGYPTGAQAVNEAYRNGQITKDHAKKLLGFCSNAGPSFIFGILACQFSHFAAPWLLWMIHITACIATGALLPGDYTGAQVTIAKQAPTVVSAAERSGRNILKVCLWILTFRVIIGFLERWFLWLLPSQIQVFVSGLLELTIGCTGLSRVANEGVRFILCSAMLGFGGLCVTMQTASSIGDLGISTYLNGKTIHALISVILAIPVQHFLMNGTEQMKITPVYWLIWAVIGGFFAVLRQKMKNKYSIIETTVV